MLELQCDLSDNGEAESPYCYLDGSLFPIKGLPYDINEKYRIIEKLGFGGFSTVWLSVGIHKENVGRWFAIKILKSNKSNQGDENKLKNDLRKLEEKSHNIIPCLDTFRIKSCYDTDDTHLCLVMKVSGPSLGAYVVTETPSIDKRRLLAINSTKLLMEMHQNDIVLDDLSSSNFLLQICSLRGFSKSQLREKIGECRSVPIYTMHESIHIPTDVPKQLYESKSLSSLVDDKLQLDLIDIVRHATFKAVTTAYAAPEVLKGASTTIESNIWGLGCLICEIMTLGSVPFEDQHYVARCQDEYFGRNDEGKLELLLQTCGDCGQPLDTKQASSLAKLLQKIFVMDPSLRFTTKMILEYLNDPKFLGKNQSILSVNAKPRSNSGVLFSIRTIKSSTSKVQSKPHSSTHTTNKNNQQQRLHAIRHQLSSNGARRLRIIDHGMWAVPFHLHPSHGLKLEIKINLGARGLHNIRAHLIQSLNLNAWKLSAKRKLRFRVHPFQFLGMATGRSKEAELEKPKKSRFRASSREPAIGRKP